MALTLEDMTEEAFEAFRGMSVQNYAKQNIKSGTRTEKEAFEKSEQSYKKMIPDGRNSSKHYFWNIANEQGERMCWLNWRFKRWMKEQESLARKDLLFMCLHTTRQPSIFIRRWAMP